ncbi:MAG: cell surface protein SprA, partial [Candidatus Eisenbacteria bacterium]|nr:cell surface protein SprA [Candidatus Eisenbacteria bacterium]
GDVYKRQGGGGQKTLAGSALSYKSQDNKLGFSTTWVYESKGAPGIEGRRPRLGQEPTRTVVGEFATSYKTPSWLIGSLVDGLPGVRTRDPGSIAIDAGMGVSLPNPNVRGELYVDDFEGAKDLNSISMNRTAWLPSAVPDSVPGLSQVEKVQRRGEAWWYSPRAAVKQGDLQPTLESRGGLADTEKDDNRSILELHFFPNGATEEERRRSWFSLVQPLSQRSTIDLSRAQFLDIWVNDFIPYERREERTGRLHLELGTVSEDAIWNRVRPEELGPNSFTLPNHELDTEDVNKDGQLDSPGSGTGEDVGLDNLPNAQEGSGDDPAYDDWAFQETQEEADRAEPSEDPGRTQRYARINGTEGNGRLDSEDLNGNLTLDQNQAYFHFVADLNDDKNPQPLVEFESSQAQDQDPKYAPYTRGWRRIRIPLTPTFYTKVGFPNWEQIKHVRIWVEGFRSEAYLQIGGIEITGNRWLKGGVRDSLGVALPDSSLFPGEDFFPAVLNNKDNSTSEYDPPFKPDERQDVEEREQSLTLEMRNFPPGHSGTVFRTFSAAQDFASLYRKLEFYVKRRLREEVPVDLDFFVRFARNADSDQDNYYEYRAPVTDGWVLHSVDMGMLSQLHLQADSNLVAFRDLGNGASISLKGNPSLTSVRRIAFGVISRGPSTIVSGNVWIDELRLASVKRDTGLASRFSMNLGLAGLGDMNFGFQRTDADFLKIGSDRGSGVTRSSLNTGARINVDRFLEGSGIVLPVSLNLAQTKDVPKFRTNSDLVLSGEARDENITETRSRDMQFSVSRSPSANPILKYTIDRISLSGNLSSNISNTPESRDTVMTRSGSISYALPLGGGPPIRVYRNTQLRLMPTNIQTTLTGGWNKRIEYRRPDNDLDLPYEETRRLVTRNGTMNWSTGLRPIEAITYQFDQTRDLRLPTAPKRVFGLRLGTEVSRRHQLTASQAIPLFGKSLVPRVSWSGSFDGRFNSITSSGLGAQQRSNGFGNSNTLTLSGSLPIDRWMRALGGIARGGGGDGGGDAPVPAPGDSTGEAPPPPRAPRGGGSSGSSIFSLGAISTTYTIGKTDRSDRVSGEPSLSYQLGLSRDPGARVEKLNGFNSSQGNRRDLNLSTDLKLLSEIQVRTSYAYGFNKNSVNGAATTTRTRRFPDLDVNWGRLGQKLGLQALMKDLRASSRYTRETREVGTSANPKDRTETTVNLRPLLNLDATLKNGISAKLTSSYSSRESEQFGNVRSLTRDRSRQVGLTLRKTLSLTRVVTNPITKKQSRATSKLDLSLALDYQDNRLESGQGGNLVVTRDIAKYALSTTGSYNFTSSITGNAGLTLGQDSDKKNKTNTARYISITVSAAFNF